MDTDHRIALPTGRLATIIAPGSGVVADMSLRKYPGLVEYLAGQHDMSIRHYIHHTNTHTLAGPDQQPSTPTHTIQRDSPGLDLF